MKFNLLKQLSLIKAVSSDEAEILKFIHQQFKGSYLRPAFTPMGDMYFGSKKPKILITAHVDEVGFIVNYINQGGTCQILPTGLIKPRMVAGERIELTNSKKNISGVVNYPHALDIDSVKKWEDLFVDFGFKSKSQAIKSGLNLGDLATYPRYWNQTNSKIIASALDNRIGVFLAVLLTKQFKNLIKSGKLTIAFTTGEESDYAGTRSTANHIRANYTVILDVLPHNFLPEKHDIKLNGQPVIVYKMTKHLLLPKLKKIIENISHQKYFIHQNNHFVLEPEVYQSFGYTNALNFLTPVTNYHQSTYTVYKTAIEKSLRQASNLIKIIKRSLI